MDSYIKPEPSDSAVFSYSTERRSTFTLLNFSNIVKQECDQFGNDIASTKPEGGWCDSNLNYDGSHPNPMSEVIDVKCGFRYDTASNFSVENKIEGTDSVLLCKMDPHSDFSDVNKQEYGSFDFPAASVKDERGSILSAPKCEASDSSKTVHVKLAFENETDIDNSPDGNHTDPIESEENYDMDSHSYLSVVIKQEHGLDDTGPNEGQNEVLGLNINARKSTHTRKNKKSKPVDPPATERYQCDICDKSYKRRDVLKKHRRTHTEQLKYKCHFCDKAFLVASWCEKHERTHSDTKPYSCATCGKKYKTIDGLKLHQQSHTGDRPFACRFCGKTFARKSVLAAHETIHTGEKNFKCKYCGKCFARLSTLRNHELTHTGEKAYQCQFCDKKFGKRHHLERHEAIHSDERQHKCKDCGKAFKTRNAVQNHEKIHLEDRPLKCEICGHGFLNSWNLKAHVKTHDKSKKKNEITSSI